MSTLTTIMNLIRKPLASAAELRSALAGIDTRPAETEVERLELERRGLLLKQGADAAIEALEARIRAGNREVERLDAAKSELLRLIGEADLREQSAELEARGAASREIERDMMRAMIELDELAVQVLARLDLVEAKGEALKLNNQIVAEHGRSDLRVAHPLESLAAHTGMHQQNLPQLWTWQLHGYRPASHPSHARALGRLKELIK